MEQSFSIFGSPTFSSPTFSSPVAAQKRSKKRSKRKCSFGSLEKPSRKQFAQRKKDGEENTVFSSKFNNSLESDDIDFSSPFNWADEVEKEESSMYKENARRKCGQERRTRKQLNMDKLDEKNVKRKSLTSEERKAFTPMMTDPHRLSQRQKQIDMGKNTLGYEMYTKHVKRNERTLDDPWTPNKYHQCSTRSWQGQIKVWRRLLHMWDPEDEANGHEDPFAVSASGSDVKDVAPTSSGGSSQTSDYGSLQVNSSFDNELFGYFQPLNRHDMADNFPL